VVGLLESKELAIVPLLTACCDGGVNDMMSVQDVQEILAIPLMG